MIPRLDAPGHTPAWQTALARGFSSVEALLEHLGIRPQQTLPAKAAAFPLRVPRGFVARMEPGNIDDPLLRQVLPVADENTIHPDYACDPLAEQQAMPAPGLLHKYHGRALLTLTGACAIHCRYCFRRHFPYTEQRLERSLSETTLAQLDSPEIEEIILSGGDPLTLGDSRLASLLEQLAGLKNLRRLRIHTRMPTVLPERITPDLARLLADFPLPVTMVLHVNHPNEYTRETDDACRLLRKSGILLLNQAVLLNKINDKEEIIEALCKRGFEAGILPYYIHQLDQVAGAAHFSTAPETARRLEKRLRERLPGYLMPRFVVEISGMNAKMPVETIICD